VPANLSKILALWKSLAIERYSKVKHPTLYISSIYNKQANSRHTLSMSGSDGDLVPEPVRGLDMDEEALENELKIEVEAEAKGVPSSGLPKPDGVSFIRVDRRCAILLRG